MCGIAGIINLNGKVQELPHHIKNMTDAISHRGPDGEGFLFLNQSEIVSAYGKDTPEQIISSSLNYSPKISVENISENNFQFALFNFH